MCCRWFWRTASLDWFKLCANASLQCIATEYCTALYCTIAINNSECIAGLYCWHITGMQCRLSRTVTSVKIRTPVTSPSWWNCGSWPRKSMHCRNRFVCNSVSPCKSVCTYVCRYVPECESVCTYVHLRMIVWVALSPLWSLHVLAFSYFAVLGFGPSEVCCH